MNKDHIQNKGNSGRDINLAGRDVVHYHNYSKQKEDLLLNPKGPNNGILEFAEWYWNFISSSKKNFLFSFILPFFGSVFVGQDYFFTRFFSNIYLTSGGIFVFILLFSVLVMRQNNSCPSCKSGFATEEIARKLLNHKLVKDTWIMNIEVTKKCRKCHYSYKFPLILEEPNDN